jgi:hypothetical protein
MNTVPEEAALELPLWEEPVTPAVSVPHQQIQDLVAHALSLMSTTTLWERYSSSSRVAGPGGSHGEHMVLGACSTAIHQACG